MAGQSSQWGNQPCSRGHRLLGTEGRICLAVRGEWAHGVSGLPLNRLWQAADSKTGGRPSAEVQTGRIADLQRMTGNQWQKSERTRSRSLLPSDAYLSGQGTRYSWRIRSCRAASTILHKAGMTSAHCRVLRPQSGLTHRRSTGMWRAARSNSSIMRDTSGTLGEWMS